MVHTRSAARKIESAQPRTNVCVLPEDVTAEPEKGVPPPAKKARREGAAVTKRRHRGKPGELCQLNLDVLFLIAAHIHPIDLLNLARTCKSLRELLMDRSSVFVWKTARQQVVGLPPCPVDLTEPEYANLVFCARCHGCSQYTTTILWNVRRRYCPGCRIRRLRPFSSCNEIIRKNSVLATEDITIKKKSSTRIDRDQATSFMNEYRQSADKNQFISDKQKECSTILQHAKKCEVWQRKRELERKADKKECQRERHRSIFERLEQQGYSREIRYFGNFYIQRCRESDFRTSKPLTDKEWKKLWPGWVEVMNKFRSQRLESDVYKPRRRSLVSAYNRYVRDPSPDAPTIELLPHVMDLARFPPFRDIIKAPEEKRVDGESFESAFAQIPVLVTEWRKKLDAELVELVRVPRRLYSRNATSRRATGPSNTAQSLNPGLDRLKLACALFVTSFTGVFNHLEVFSVSMLYRTYDNDPEDDAERSWSILDQFGIRFLEEAPYIVQACGLDPSMATSDDMDHRNARLKCLCCEGPTLIMNWRHAMSHASSCHEISSTLAPLSKSPRWQLVDDEYIDKILAVEQSINGNIFPSSTRCLLCKPHVGDVIANKREAALHLYNCHNLKIEDDNIKLGEHYASIGIYPSPRVAVEMVKDRDQVTFRVPPK